MMSNLKKHWTSLQKLLVTIKQIKTVFLLLALMLSTCILPVVGQSGSSANDPPKQNTRILFLFDASQSMYGSWESDIKYEVARRLMNHLADSLDRLNHVQMALRV